MIIVSAVSIYRRHDCVYVDLIGSIAKLRDSRVAEEEERTLLASEYEANRPCSIATGVAHGLKEANVTAEALLNDRQWHDFLLWRFHMVAEQLCDVELKHVGIATVRIITPTGIDSCCGLHQLRHLLVA